MRRPRGPLGDLVTSQVGSSHYFIDLADISFAVTISRREYWCWSGIQSPAQVISVAVASGVGFITLVSVGSTSFTLVTVYVKIVSLVCISTSSPSPILYRLMKTLPRVSLVTCPAKIAFPFWPACAEVR